MLTVAALGLVLLALPASTLVVPRAWARLARVFYPSVIFFGPAGCGRVALTIDDGPDPVTTPAILDALDRLETQATFFLIGERAAAAPALVREIRARGHEVGHHLWRDWATVLLSTRTLEEDADRTSAALGGALRWLRPGHGWVSRPILDTARRRGLQVVVGDVPALDPRLPYPRVVAAYLRLLARPGAILTLHDHGARGDRTVAILEHLLPRLRARKLAVGTLSALMDDQATCPNQAATR